MKDKNYIVKNNIGLRLDKYLVNKNIEISRTYIQKLINEGNVTVNNKKSKPGYKVNEGDDIRIYISEPEDLELKPVDIKMDILYEDQNIIVVNKPAGLVVHPVKGNRETTLANALLGYTDKLSGINGVKRPGIVHRLDKDTSGVLVVAKNDNSHRDLVEQFKKRKTRKLYRLITKGSIKYNCGKIDAPIGRNPNDRKKMAVVRFNNKKAITHFRVIEKYKDYSYVEARLETGRTHQIRVHFSYMGYPVLGDEKYSRKKNKLNVKRQLLHACCLGLYHPASKKWMEFTAPLPDDFKKVLNMIKSLTECTNI
ncbi:MAG TPA: RluA family pseudouridine synthase [Halanaerobiales bacterium]|nr:RluA family pseudouridine synthase [Halanaerobiales bacterium]